MGGLAALPVSASAGDGDLVRACRNREARAWELLVERFARYVYAIAAQAYRLPEHDAEDVFQEVFTRTYEHLDGLRSDEAIRPWIGQLTRRLAIDRLRISAREQPGIEALANLEPAADRELVEIELAMSVRTSMAALPEQCQEILDRFYARGQTYREIAATLDVPAGTVASRISRCLTKLRVELQDSG